MEQKQQQNMPKGFGFGSASTPVDAAAVNEAIFRLPPFFYMHVLDLNKNVTRIETGPKTYIRQDNERVTLSPSRMITVPPRHYCVIENPVVRDAANAVVLDNYGQAKLHHADLDVRLTHYPFPLYPGEVLKENVQPLRVVPADSALLLKAVLDFDADEVHRVAGDEWLFEGPGTYVPRKEAHVETTVRASVVKPNQALKLRARRETTDRDGTLRVTGEEWLVSKVGAYLPGAYEEVVETVDAVILTEKKALHIEAVRTFTDQLGVLRRSGEQWLVTMKDAEAYIPGVYEVIVEIITITTLTNREYCVVLNPVDSSGKPQLGKRRLVKGPQTFFLLPGETLQDGIQAVFVLGENEGLILRANEAYTDSSGDKSISRQPGDRWMIRGPLEYVPPVEVEVLMMRQAIPLDENEGIYVRDVRSGRVRAVVGETYMLTQDEELWEKVLPKGVEELLPRDPLSDRGFNTMQMMANMPMQQQKTKKRENIEQQRCVPEGMRDRTKVVSYRVPHNAAVQIYDYKEKNARVVFGPDLVMLGPDEHFTTLSLSGGKPKKPNVIKSLCLLLGPDFCTDIITVETADHARLQLQLAYNWNFRVSRESAASNATSAARLFSVPDFVGDMCNSLASRIRGSVAAVNFDDFHKNSARIIRSSVFGFDEQQKVRDVIEFEQNELCVTNVDIQGVEPIDQRTRDALQKSVQLAIEITTNSQEATAKHEAQRLEQEAKGRLERQRIADSATAEKTRKELLELQAASAAVESTGQAKAEALSQAEAAKIEAQAAVERAKLKAQAAQIEAEENLRADMSRREAELKYATEQNELEITKARELAAIETKKTSETIAALGTETIRAIATAGPEMQVRLLQSLGIRSTLITDGKTPINLLQTAQGLIGGPTVQQPEE